MSVLWEEKKIKEGKLRRPPVNVDVVLTEIQTGYFLNVIHER